MSFPDFLEKYLDKRMGEIFQGVIGKIETFDQETLRADVIPLLKIGNDLEEIEDLPILSDLPVIFMPPVKPLLASGDLVWLGFSTYDIENALLGYSRKASAKMFDLNNACVIGKIIKDNGSISGLQIYQTDSALIIGDINGIHLRVDTAGIAAVSGPGIEFNIITHSHPTPAGPAGPPTVGT